MSKYVWIKFSDDDIKRMIEWYDRTYGEGFNDDEDDKLNSELKYIKDDIII